MQQLIARKPSLTFLGSLDPTACALLHKAHALGLEGSVTSAIQAFRDLERFPSRSKQALLQAGLLAEKSGDLANAADLYSRIAASSPSPRTDDAAQLCRRALLRMQDAAAVYFASQYLLKDALTSALEHRDVRQLERLLSSTHFAVGPIGGHTAFESADIAQELARDLATSTVTQSVPCLAQAKNSTCPPAAGEGAGLGVISPSL